MKKNILITIAIVAAVLLLALTGGSFYMLNYSLGYAHKPGDSRADTDSAYAELYRRAPDMRPWCDSLLRLRLLRDTFVTMPSGERHHAIYLRCDSARGRSAVVVHGYTDNCLKFLYLGRMYHRDLGYNILMPDLHAHGKSEGEEIQMGWKDRFDVIRWTEVAEHLFRDSEAPSRVVVHGVSMGAATTMCVSGESLPAYVQAFVEDCGYTSVWDEFSGELRAQFSLPPFPLLFCASALCKLRYGWSFGEAAPIKQVAKCQRPMLFIHGDADTYVPFAMMKPLYDAKPQPKAMWVAPGSKHADAYLDHRATYTAQVRQFLDAIPR
ncbi:MAG: alpha/beta hydrolase [Bacteroidales bacterium]|nr:alpha/beta hydrolase [Bacteroidales bacterium]